MYSLAFASLSGNKTLSFSLLATKDSNAFWGTFTNLSVVFSLVLIIQMYSFFYKQSRLHIPQN